MKINLIYALTGTFCYGVGDWVILMRLKTALTISLKTSGFVPGPGIYRLAWVTLLGKFEVTRYKHVRFLHRVNMGPTKDGDFSRNLDKRPPLIFWEQGLAVNLYQTYRVAYLGKFQHKRTCGRNISHVKPMEESENIFQVQFSQISGR